MYISIYTITSANFSDHAILYVYIYILDIHLPTIMMIIVK